MQEKSVKKNLSALVILFALFASVFFVPIVHASLIFSDDFSDGFNSSWYIYPGRESPEKYVFGLTGNNSNNLSTIAIPLSQNSLYKIEFDLKINNPNSNHLWSIGIGDDINRWKIINTWGEYLQLKENTETGEVNTYFSWDKSTSEPHHFEIYISPQSITTFSVIEDRIFKGSLQTQSNFDISLLWISLQGYGDYEIANFKLCDNNDCGPVPPPPTKKKVIVIPGYFGSFNTAELVACDTSFHFGKWNHWLGGDLFYQPLIQALTNANFDVLPFYYDWRLTAPTNADALASYIQANIPDPNEKFDIIAHSFGGLVARAYLEIPDASERIDHLLTAGTPHRGTAVAYPAWAAGEIWIDDFLGDILKGLVKWCGKANGTDNRTTVQTIAPSVQNLLPIDPYLTDAKTGNSIENEHIVNTWLLGHPFPNIYDISLATLNGSGYKTLSSIAVTSDMPQKTPSGYWLDGYAKEKDSTKIAAGDGTVLNSSSTLDETEINEIIPSGHKDLVSSEEGQRVILDFLGATSAETVPYTPTPHASSLMIIADPGMFWVSQPDGSIHKGDHIYVTENPTKGAYKLLFIPTSLSSKILIGKFLPNGKTIWKTYENLRLTPKFESIVFDPDED